MIIKKMTASFGALNNETLELEKGLNIINSPNESGKSTWCAFIRSMLYGIDTNARTKNGIKPDKLKYLPWNGSPMYGVMELENGKDNLTIDRRGREGSPLRILTVTDTETGERIPMTNEDLGEKLLGVSKDVFERSAFIGQGKIAVGSSPDLEKKIAAIVETGTEDISLSQALEQLKSAKRRRRYNKSGRLPELELEIAKTRQELMEIEKLKKASDQLTEAKTQAIKRRDIATNKVSDIRRELRQNAMNSLKEYTNQKSQQETIQLRGRQELEAAKQKLMSGTFAMDKPEDTLKISEKLIHEEEALKAKAKKGMTPFFSVSLFLIFVICGIGLCVCNYMELLAFSQEFIGYGLGALWIIIGFYCLIAGKKAKKKRLQCLEDAKELYTNIKCRDREDLAKKLKEHAEDYKAYTDKIAELEELDEKCKILDKERRELEEKILKELDFSASDPRFAEFSRELEEEEHILHKIRESLAQIEGRKSAVGNFKELSNRLEECITEYERISDEYEALDLAAACLEKSAEQMQGRIAPALGRSAMSYFKRFTNERYDAMELDRSLKAKVRSQGENISHEADFLSGGAMDQLYLSVRLALCDLALPDKNLCPLVLDDAFVNFDDNRLRDALKVILELAEKRQIILFTCHEREAKILEFLRNSAND